MRKLILSCNTSLDGFMGGPGGDMSWMVDDEEMDHDFTTDIRQRADTMLAGRATYQSFEGAWPAMAADGSLTPEMAAFARWMVETPIVVFSRSTPQLGMPTARLARRGIAEEVADLKAQPGGDIAIFGGASTVAEVVRLGLVDEYWFKLEPVAVGRGLAVFGRLDAPADLALVWSKVYRSGVVGVRYETVKQPETVVRSRYVRD
ncbi:MAG TPA: dihydrofolate reductase family protein [Acidimicrobiales bacterium]|nr:dihydrofolate reductase family protein [Acidimicrobiales bacterium]